MIVKVYAVNVKFTDNIIQNPVTVHNKFDIIGILFKQIFYIFRGFCI